MEKSKRVVGYARVSTEAQDITRQIELITAYCSDRNYHLIKIIQEKISGARKDRKSRRYDYRVGTLPFIA